MHDDTLLDKLDNYLSTKKVTEVYLIYVIVVGLIVFFIYSFVFPEAESFYNTNTAKLRDITSKLSSEEKYIFEGAPQVAQLDGDIKRNTELLKDARYVNGYVDGKLKELSYLLFNDQSWASFMDRITALAKEYKINIIKIENDFKDNKDLENGKIEQVLNIDINSRGTFHNVIKFINALEESQLVVDVYESTISSNTTSVLDTDVKLAVWGMLY
ncbi:MAG: hypothetical protein LBQ18_08240 [Campylobacteraceae bacterium]|jgi:predicted S18 family serine protease|nr:hypothetical protein [Campylobacteraceae bacterium]